MKKYHKSLPDFILLQFLTKNVKNTICNTQNGFTIAIKESWIKILIYIFEPHT